MTVQRLLGCVVGVALAVSVVSTRQNALHRFERPFVIDGSGPWRLPVDLPLLQGAAHFSRLERIQHRDGAYWRAVDGLADLRLVDGAGRDVPYLLIYPRAADPGWQDGALLPIGTVPNKSSGFEVDLGGVARVDALHVDGIPPPFLKRLVLEGSGDRVRWTVLDDEATLFDLPQEALKGLSVAFEPGNYRYLRVTWNDTNSGRVPLPRAARARLADARSDSTPPTRVEVTVERRPSEPGRSRYRVRLPAGRLPAVALLLEVGGGHVYRVATAYESALQGTAAAPLEIGRATLSRIVREGAVAEDLRIPIARPRDTQLELAIEDGSNPPLELQRAWVELAELPWIYFEAPNGEVTARYGAAGASAPRYDLEAARHTIRIGEVAQARWGSPSAVTSSLETSSDPERRRPQPGPPIDLSGYRHERTLSGAPGLAVVAVDAAILAHSRGPDAGFADLRIVDVENRQVPYLLERLQEPLSVPVGVEGVEATARELTTEGRNRSVYAIRPPFEGLPPASLVIETSGRLFTRAVRLGVQRPPDRGHRDAWFQELAAARWTHTDDDGVTPSLSLRVPALDQPLVLVIDEGDNSPLPITAARLLFPAYRLRFYSPEGQARLVYGNEKQGPPQYDFELLATRILGADATEVSLGEERALGGGSTGGGTPQLLSPRLFWAGLIVAVLILGALIVRMLRTREG